jgi:epoxyqueuosine reductase
VKVPTPSETADSQRVLELARELGFGLVGIASAEPSGHAESVRQWIADGRHGEMGYLENHLDVRLDPGKLLEGARSVICVADLYPAETVDKASGPAPHGKIARYAYGDDYHKTIKKRLHKLADVLALEHPAEKFRSTVDTAPILERDYAAVAGLGWIGKHTLLIHPQLGSYMLLGTVVTTLELMTSEEAGYPAPTVSATDHCGTCTRCIDACPTQCISTEAPSVDATRCISYLTLEHRSEIDPGLHPLMGDWIAGCDVCQEVCPHNRDRGSVIVDPGTQAASAKDAGTEDDSVATSRSRFSPPPIHAAYTPRPPAPGLSLLEILSWSEEDRRATFKGSALKRIKLGMFKRNALISAGNYLNEHDDAELRRRVIQVADDETEPELVRVTARQVIDRLEHGSGRGDQ